MRYSSRQRERHRQAGRRASEKDDGTTGRVKGGSRAGVGA